MKKTILLSALFAVLAVLSAYVYFSSLEVKYRNMGETSTVVVANRTIAAGTLIRRNMLATMQVPKAYIQPKAFTSIDDLFDKDGRAVFVALSSIEENEQILPGKVSDASKEVGMSYIIPDGRKALAVSFDTDSSNIIAPGSRVDILASIEYTDARKQYHEAVYVIAQNILVLAVGNDYFGNRQPQQANTNSIVSNGGDEQQNKSLITLSVSVEEAQIIFIAGEHGNLKYILRPVGDSELYKSKVIKMSDLISDIVQTQSPNTRSGSANQEEIMRLINTYSKQ
ncbi:MAG: Flp pilus assembly protein CpaB [Elusimicrobiota bacterium]|jgi:pilus assembly protein CpaB|nr:Flp pilus assembly protein CpaB [Elusimicrobiota bacterium]